MVDGNDLKEKKGLPLTIIHLVKVILARPRDVNANFRYKRILLGVYSYFIHILLTF